MKFLQDLRKCPYVQAIALSVIATMIFCVFMLVSTFGHIAKRAELVKDAVSRAEVVLMHNQ